jgi:hypothetical protein
MRALDTAVVLALLALGGPAAGSEAGSEENSPAETEAREVRAELEGGLAPEERPFAFVVDPSIPDPGSVAVAYTVGLGSGISAERPIPVVLQGAGLSNQLSVGYGATRWLEPIAEVTATSTSERSYASATLGVKLRLTAAGSPWRAAVLAGALREGPSGAYGTWLRASGSWGTGPLLVDVNGYAEHVFLAGRDAIDYAVMGGVSWRLLASLRVGAEYVGQDLEEVAASRAEGGARQAVGPNVAFDLDHGRYKLVAATLFGVGALSPTALVRIGLLGSL